MLRVRLDLERPAPVENSRSGVNRAGCDTAAKQNFAPRELLAHRMGQGMARRFVRSCFWRAVKLVRRHVDTKRSARDKSMGGDAAGLAPDGSTSDVPA